MIAAAEATAKVAKRSKRLIQVILPLGRLFSGPHGPCSVEIANGEFSPQLINDFVNKPRHAQCVPGSLREIL
jgi:hypothetical protein